MKNLIRSAVATLLLPLLLAVVAGRPYALTLGQVDDFEDGTTQGWTVGLLGAAHPAPPVNFPSGGPLGTDDNYLRLTSLGGQGAGSRLTAINLNGQWAGDYTATGVHGIGMDIRNLGNSELSLRLLLADPAAGPPTNAAVSSDGIVLPPGSGWTSAFFPILPADLTAVVGSVGDALSGATELRLFHSTFPGFPGEPLVAELGVDNIRALAAPVPEPSAWMLLAGGLVVAGWASRGRLVPRGRGRQQR